MIESDTLQVLTSQVEAMNFQLFAAQKQILDLRQMDISIGRMLFLMTMIMLFEALAVMVLAWKVCER